MSSRAACLKFGLSIYPVVTSSHCMCKQDQNRMVFICNTDLHPVNETNDGERKRRETSYHDRYKRQTIESTARIINLAVFYDKSYMDRYSELRVILRDIFKRHFKCSYALYANYPITRVLANSDDNKTKEYCFIHLTFKWHQSMLRSRAFGKLSDCRSRGCEFDPGPVPYFRGDWSWNNFYGHSSPFCWFIQEGLLSVTIESMCANNWLTASSSLPRKKSG